VVFLCVSADVCGEALFFALNFCECGEAFGVGASIACGKPRSYIRVRALIVAGDHEDPEWIKLDESFSSRHHNRRRFHHSPRITQAVAMRPTCSPHLYRSRPRAFRARHSLVEHPDCTALRRARAFWFIICR